jgi:hypothetical protein
LAYHHSPLEGLKAGTIHATYQPGTTHNGDTMPILETPANYTARQEFAKIAIEKFKDQAYWLVGNTLDLTLLLKRTEDEFLALAAKSRDWENG